MPYVECNVHLSVDVFSFSNGREKKIIFNISCLNFITYAYIRSLQLHLLTAMWAGTLDHALYVQPLTAHLDVTALYMLYFPSFHLI